VTGAEPALRIVTGGRGTTVQDHGRPGYAHLGVPTAGAVDPEAHDLANRLVGNPVGAATIETNGGLVFEAIRPLVAAVGEHRHTLAAGERLPVDPTPGAMWTYLAVRGGIAVEPVLGSRSHDSLSALGPPPLIPGMELPVGPDPGTELLVDLAPRREPPAAVRVWAAAREEVPGALDVLTGRRWSVTADVSRVGVRLEPGDFPPATRPDRASEALVPGAIQLTPAGQPIVLLANHPTTGGYPVIGVVDPDDLGIVAQTSPGSTLRFLRA
jgi:biotin-dependent carboxylase-like uncharacterized protein